MERELLMVFVKNAEIGKVKTRLAATVGDQVALDVYRMLMQHTLSVSSALDLDKMVFYSERIDHNDVWWRHGFKQHLQHGEDLGRKMLHAFKHAQQNGYTNTVIIGSDCLELSTPILETAFHELQNYDLVVGPARDGGYYLLGMKGIPVDLFSSKQWSTDAVLRETLEDAGRAGLKVFLLPRLADIDEATDLPDAWRRGVIL